MPVLANIYIFGVKLNEGSLMLSSHIGKQNRYEARIDNVLIGIVAAWDAEIYSYHKDNHSFSH